VLTRSIDNPFELSIKEKVFYCAKRACVAFAVIAMTISGLDLMDIRPLDGAAEFVQQHRHAHLADWPRRMRQAINEMSISAEASVVVAIPDDRLAMDPLPALNSPKVMTAKPTAAHRADAEQVEMASPPVFAHATLDDLARRAEAMARQARDMAAPSF
jgi:hypothetical protein